MGLCNDVLVLYRNDWHIDSNHLTGLAGKVARCTNHVLAFNRAVSRMNRPASISSLFNSRDCTTAVNLSTQRASAHSQSLCQVSWLDITILRMLYRAEQAIGSAERPQITDFIRFKKPNIYTDRPGNTGVVTIFVEPVFSHRQTNIRDLSKTNGISGFLFKALVKINRILMDLPYRITHIKQWQKSGGMPG